MQIEENMEESKVGFSEWSKNEAKDGSSSLEILNKGKREINIAGGFII